MPSKTITLILKTSFTRSPHFFSPQTDRILLDMKLFTLMILFASECTATTQQTFWSSSSSSNNSLAKRQTVGYFPIANDCGSGSSCSAACGEEFLQCPAEDSFLHCYSPHDGQKCCSDDTGCESLKLGKKPDVDCKPTKIDSRL